MCTVLVQQMKSECRPVMKNKRGRYSEPMWLAISQARFTQQGQPDLHFQVIQNVTLSRESGLGLGTLGTRALVSQKACALNKQSIYSYSCLDCDHHKTPSH